MVAERIQSDWRFRITKYIRYSRKIRIQFGRSIKCCFLITYTTYFPLEFGCVFSNSKLLLYLLFKCLHIRKLCVTASVSIKNFRLRCRKSRKLIVQRNGKSKLFSFACGSISNCTQFLCRALESEYAVRILCSLFERQLFFYVAFHTITWHLTLRWSLADAKLLCSSLPACSNAAGITAQQFGCCIVESLPER